MEKTSKNNETAQLGVSAVVWRYLSYPIRYLLRHKVERYKVELEQIRWRQQHLKLKARRCGMTETVFYFMNNDMFLSIKYERFIKRFDVGQSEQGLCQ